MPSAIATISIGGAIDVAVYDDRVEIWSTGGLPHGLSADLLDKPHRSIRRNGAISNTFYCAGLIEQWGRGTNKIVDLCVAAQLEPPRFVADFANVGVIFPAAIGVTEIVTGTRRKPADRRREIVRLLQKNQRMPLAKIREYFDVAERTLQDDLAYLKEKQQIDSQGYGRAAFWYWVGDPK